MVFGSTYCLVCHLEIKEGDEFYCFEIKKIGEPYDFFKFDFNKLSNNDFLPKLVIWNGNYFSTKEKNNLSDYFLLNKNFYDNLIKEDFGFKYITNLPNIIFCLEIKDYLFNYQLKKREELKNIKNQLKLEDYFNQYMNVEIPENIKNIYKLSFFIYKMGMVLYPNITNDQHNFGQIYKNILKKSNTQ